MRVKTLCEYVVSEQQTAPLALKFYLSDMGEYLCYQKREHT